jgi:hypothetical protein
MTTRSHGSALPSSCSLTGKASAPIRLRKRMPSPERITSSSWPTCSAPPTLIRPREQLAAGMKAVHDDLVFTLSCGSKAYDALLDESTRLGLIDPTKKLAVGYCAGGGFVLEQARGGADFNAVVVLHVTNPNPVAPGTPCNIKGRVLAIHGSADPITPKSTMDAFEDELTQAKIDWQVVMFGGAVHSFCDPTANAGPTRYDEKLCRQSYRLMRDFFDETP